MLTHARHGGDPRPVAYIIGSLLIVLSAAMLVPALVDYAQDHQDWISFAVAAALTLFFGVLLVLTNRLAEISLTLRQTFMLTAASYVVLSLFAALPFLFSEVRPSVTDAVFEAVSGLTTTGATVFVGLEGMPPGILIWRAMLQWLGGIGIIAIGIAILPFLRVGGMQLFRSESSDRSDKVVPRAADLAKGIGWFYLGFTAITILALSSAGLALFDAVCLALTSVSTGGYAPRDASVGAYATPAAEWVLVVVMIVGALPFVRFVSLLRGEVAPIWRDSQVRTFLALLALFWAVMTAWRVLASGIALPEALREVAFNVTSIITTSGFAVSDYSAWGAFAVGMFFLIMFIGGCTGSTSGGMKIFRFQILFLALSAQINRLHSPSRVRPLRFEGRLVGEDVMLAVVSFLFVFFASLLVMTVGLSAFGLDFITAVSGAAAALANVGPGLGPVIGPAGNFSSLPDGAKLLLAFAMLLGRLEFFTILVLLHPGFWRR